MNWGTSEQQESLSEMKVIVSFSYDRAGVRVDFYYTGCAIAVLIFYSVFSQPGDSFSSAFMSVHNMLFSSLKRHGWGMHANAGQSHPG